MILQICLFFFLRGITGKLSPKSTKGKEFLLAEDHHPSYYFMPNCIDNARTYLCYCGPGFTWNTHSCIADGLNSHFEFPTGHSSTFHYAEISNHPVSQLSNFTLAFWIKVFDLNHKGIILTYSSMTDNTTIFTFLSGPTLSMLVYSVPANSSYKLKPGKWTHVLWKWNVTYGIGKWSLFVDGNFEASGQVLIDNEKLRTASIITFILGHSSLVLQIQDNVGIPESKCCRFEGNVGFVNMWSYQLQEDEITYLINDCKLRTTGDVFQWSNFRSGTRGLKIRWPSDIFDTQNCFSYLESIKSCDKFCSLEKEPKCQEELLENILWLRTPADTSVKIPCPNSTNTLINETQQNYISRRCIKFSSSEGIWASPVVDGCISRPQLSLKVQTKKLLKLLPNKANDIPGLMSFLNFSSLQSNSIFDISTSIQCLNNLTKAQSYILRKFWTSTTLNISTFGLNRKSDMTLYPSLSNSNKFIKTSASAINNLLKPVNEKLWLDSNPPGSLTDALLHTMENWFALIADTLHFHLAKGELMQPETAQIHLEHENFELRVGMFQKSNVKEIFESKGPKYKFGNENSILKSCINKKQIKKRQDVEHHDETLETDYQTFSFGILWVRDILNKHPEDLLHQKLNAGLFFFMTHHNNGDNEYELTITFPFIVTSNISQSKCVRVEHGNGLSPWEFSSSSCETNYINSTHINCNCSLEGFYGVLSDLFDPNYVAPDKELNYVTYPTYFGCFASIILCGATSLCLCLRSSSNAPAIHRHFSISIIMGHLLFMFGTEEVSRKLVCLVIATLQHFFTLSSFCWLMNEAFNLYILITYSTHSRTENLDEGGSMLKYYIIGWAFPALFVGSFCGANLGDYLSLKMCYISWKHIIFVFVPVAIIIVVTLLVLIFTVKEQMESSYSKNEKTNEIISIYSKALWTQIVLLLLCWLFALASLFIEGNIIKLLQSFFNLLQGVFFYIFFYHLNEEVRNGAIRRLCIPFKKRKRNEDIPMTPRSGEILWDGNRPRGMNMLESEKLLHYKDMESEFHQLELFTQFRNDEYHEGDELVTTV